MTVKEFKAVGNMGEIIVSYNNEEMRYYDFVHTLGAEKVWDLKIVGIEAKAKSRVKKNTNELEVIPYTLLYLSDDFSKK